MGTAIRNIWFFTFSINIFVGIFLFFPTVSRAEEVKNHFFTGKALENISQTGLMVKGTLRRPIPPPVLKKVTLSVPPRPVPKFPPKSLKAAALVLAADFRNATAITTAAFDEIAGKISPFMPEALPPPPKRPSEVSISRETKEYQFMMPSLQGIRDSIGVWRDGLKGDAVFDEGKSVLVKNIDLARAPPGFFEEKSPASLMAGATESLEKLLDAAAEKLTELRAEIISLQPSFSSISFVENISEEAQFTLPDFRDLEMAALSFESIRGSFTSLKDKLKIRESVEETVPVRDEPIETEIDRTPPSTFTESAQSAFQKIIERVIVEVPSKAPVATNATVSFQTLARSLNELENKLKLEIYRVGATNAQQSFALPSFPLSSRIDFLTKVVITEATITGSSFSGSVSGSSGTFSDSLTVSGTASTSALLVSNGFFQGGFEDCAGSGDTVIYTLATGKFGCDPDAGGGSGSPGGSTGQVQFNNGGNFAGNNSLFIHIASGRVGLSTTTPYGALSIATSTRPQLLLSDSSAGVDLKHFYASSTQGSLVIGTINDALTLLTPQLSISSGGITTFSGGIVSSGASSTIVNLWATNATTTNATTTNLAVSGTASTSALVISSAGTGSTKCLQVSGTGLVSAAASACGSGGGGGVPDVTYTLAGGTTYYTASTTATDNLSWYFGNGFVSKASSTLTDFTATNGTTTNATSTNLSVSGIASISALTVSGSFSQTGFGDCQGPGNTVVYTLSTGKFGCDPDGTGGGGGGSEINWTYAPNAGDPASGLIYMSTTTNQTVVGATATSSLAKLEVIGNQYISGNLGIGTTSPYAKLSVVGEIVGAFFTATTTANSTFPNLIATNATTTTFAIGSLNGPLQANAGRVSATSSITHLYGGTGLTAAPTFGQVLRGTGSGYALVATSTLGIALTDTTGTLAGTRGGTGLSSITLNQLLVGAAGNTWTQIATSSLGLTTTNVAEGTNAYYLDSRVQSFIHASTTIPKTYTANTFTGANVFNGTFTIGSLNGPLDARNGVVGATTSITHLYGGTGLTATPTFGQMLRGTGSGYALVATSTLGIALTDTTGTLAINRGGTNSTAQTTNGVSFFNGSSITSGTGFTFDGTKTGIGSTSPSALLSVHANNGATNRLLLAIASSTASATTTLFSVDNTGLATFGDSSGTGDATFQFADDIDAWSMGYFSADKTFRIASSTNLSANVLFQIGKSGTTTLSSGLGTGTGGNYLCIDTTTFEILRGNGAACTASSLRFKENIQELSYGIDDVMKLHPVMFTYRPEMNSGTSTHLGFIAEEVELIIPELVSYNSQGRIQGLDYPVVTALLTKALQEINQNLEAIASTTASSTLAAQAFAESFFDGIFDRFTQWFADATNGIGDFLANRIRTKELCVRDDSGAETCITKSQLDSLITGQSASALPASSTETESTSVDTEAPVIVLSGNNPATINVGDTYGDLGAIVTDNVSDNLGYSVSLDGGPAIDPSQLSLDTSAPGTHTILFSATDGAGNTGTATRTVNVVDPNAVAAPVKEQTPPEGS